MDEEQQTKVQPTQDSSPSQQQQQPSPTQQQQQQQNEHESGQPAFKKQKLVSGSLPDVSKIDLTNGLAVKNALSLYDEHLKKSTVSETDLPAQFSIDRAKLLKYNLKHTQEVDKHVRELERLGYDPSAIKQLNTESRNAFFDYVAADATFRVQNQKKNDERVKSLEEEVEKLKKEKDSLLPKETKREPLEECHATDNQPSYTGNQYNMRSIDSGYLAAFHGARVPQKQSIAADTSSANMNYEHIFSQGLADRGIF